MRLSLFGWLGCVLPGLSACTGQHVSPDRGAGHGPEQAEAVAEVAQAEPEVAQAEPEVESVEPEPEPAQGAPQTQGNRFAPGAFAVGCSGDDDCVVAMVGCTDYAVRRDRRDEYTRQFRGYRFRCARDLPPNAHRAACEQDKCVLRRRDAGETG